jgi:hypothetical protein
MGKNSKKPSTTTRDSSGETSQQFSPVSSRQGENSDTTLIPSELPADMAVVKDIFSMMKKTLGILDNTLESLGDSSAKFVEISPAIEAAAQVSVLHINYIFFLHS